MEFTQNKNKDFDHVLIHYVVQILNSAVKPKTTEELDNHFLNAGDQRDMSTERKLTSR